MRRDTQERFTLPISGGLNVFKQCESVELALQFQLKHFEINFRIF